MTKICEEMDIVQTPTATTREQAKPETVDQQIYLELTYMNKTLARIARSLEQLCSTADCALKKSR